MKLRLLAEIAPATPNIITYQNPNNGQRFTYHWFGSDIKPVLDRMRFQISMGQLTEDDMIYICYQIAQKMGGNTSAMELIQGIRQRRLEQQANEKYRVKDWSEL